MFMNCMSELTIALEDLMRFYTPMCTYTYVYICGKCPRTVKKMRRRDEAAHCSTKNPF